MKKSSTLIGSLLLSMLVAPISAHGTNAATRVALAEPPGRQTRKPANVPVELRTSLDKIVEYYRKIIVLLDDEATLAQEERNRCIYVGRKIHQEKQELLEEVAQTLTSDLRRAIASKYQQKPEFVSGFIEYFTDNPGLRDVDRLAFTDLADEILSIDVQDERNHGLSKSSTQSALQRVNDDLKLIQGVYQKEVSRVFSSLGTRGKAPEREKWQDYVTFIKGLFSRDQVLNQYDRGKPEDDEGLRGARHDSKTEVYGYDLPPKSIVLTFDDGPHPRYTDEILAILKKYNARAFFFDVGKCLGSVTPQNEVKLSANANVSKRVLEAGHLLANHSYSHPDLTKLSPAERGKEIGNTNLLLEKVSGAKNTLFRPPYGAKNLTLSKEVEALGLKSVLWTLDSLDWADPISDSIARRVLTQVTAAKKGILLMHDIHKQSVAALPRILEELSKQGYTFLILDGDQFVPSSSPVMASSRAHNSNNSMSQAADSEGIKRNYYRDSWAVIVGINDYQNWPKLRYCVNDANAVEQMLINQYGFKKSNIIKLLDKEATRERIVWALGDQLSDPNKVRREDRVFVFFAGHGATRKLPSGKELGYIVPVDAESEASQAKSISMAQLQEFCELIPAKHLYFVVDSCYSGLALTRSGGASSKSTNYLEEITKRMARQILTAGGADQQVADNGPGGHSIFTWTLLQGLQGLADTDGNGAITASELGAYISPIVSSVSHQTPAFGNLSGSEGGEFVFELQQESLTEASKQLDEEAIRLNNELERIQQELAAKRERNLKLRGKVEEERAKLEGTNGANRGNPAPKSKSAQAQEHHNLGLKYYREKKYDDAVNELQEAVKLDPRSATIVNNLGFTLYRSERYEESLVWLLKAIEIDPRRSVAYANLADAYMKLGKTTEARQYYEKYAEMAPNSPTIEYVRKKLEELKGK
ncbi:MAG TPA: polysaccharide deacetylase family protein [Blastocatellia bacterium]|nr:polysaccharide deacetylase family protein [Blastocatellia bacterium]